MEVVKMAESQKKDKRNPDVYVDLYHRFAALDNGLKAALRRVPEPEELWDTVAFYRLFYQAMPDDRWRRVVFLLPWCAQCKEGTESVAPTFGAQMAGKVNEMRILQMARAKEPFDILQLRRLAIQIRPIVNWARLGRTLFYWTREDKRNIVEDFYYPQSNYNRKGVRL
jgi:CRISPR system Cascade subunit CasB